MKIPRRFLPSIALLQAFETAARTHSITAAAAELALTQSAVSRQIRALEMQLGTALFHRERQTIRLTPGGEAYAQEIRAALHKISAASLNLRANPGGGTLTLAILPTFGTRWLAPRLPEFLSAHPGITLNLVTRLTQFDFAAEAVDAAIHFGAPDWPGAECTWLRGEHVVPACAPDLAARLDFATLDDLRAAPLLHLASRPDAWEKFFERKGMAPQHLHGMQFDQFATVAQAAMVGLGVALLPEFLIEDEIASGRLVVPLHERLRSEEGYYLCAPRGRGPQPPLAAFRDWLCRVATAAEAAETALR